MLWTIIGCVFAGVLIGIGLTEFKYRTIGTLKIDHTDPSKDVYRFEINNLSVLDKKTVITLRVDHHADLSQN